MSCLSVARFAEARTLSPLAMGTAIALAAATPTAASDCPAESAETAASLAEAWRSAETVAAPTVPDTLFARCVRDALVAELAAVAGEPVGWKVGLTSQAAQSAFGVDHPVAGILLAEMLVEDGATVPQAFGARPIVEADLIATVASADIMQATTPEEVLAALESFSPFIELADLAVAPGEPLVAETIVAINVGARLGVVGAPFVLEPTAEGVAALAGMTVEIAPAGGQASTIPGAAILGNPLNAMLWLVEHLTAVGEALEPGDVVSLGSFGPPMPARDLTGLTVTYRGLPVDAAPSVSVTFE